MTHQKHEYKVCLDLWIGTFASNLIAIWCRLFDVDLSGFIYGQNIRSFYPDDQLGISSGYPGLGSNLRKW